MISIAMCTYNGERFLKEQIDSILNQSYKNFELIITDDCSSDKTIEIIKEYLKHDDRIKLFQNEKNLGFIKNFEKAISLCSGEYIALADQDDIWKGNKLEVFLKEIKDNVLIYSDAILIDKNSKELGRTLVKSEDRSLVSGKCNKSFILTNCISGNTLMFKKELVQYILPIPENISFHDIWIAFVASSYGTITYTDESMTYYRRYEEQVTHRSSADTNGIFGMYNYSLKRSNKYIKQLLMNLNIYSKLNIVDDETKTLINKIHEHLINYDKDTFDSDLKKQLFNYNHQIYAIFNKKNTRTFEIATVLKYYNSNRFYIKCIYKGIFREMRLKTKDIRYKILRKREI